MKRKLLRDVTMMVLSFSLVFNVIPVRVLAAEITKSTKPTEISAENTYVEATEPVSEPTIDSKAKEPIFEMATDSGVITAKPETLMEMRAPAAVGLNKVYIDTQKGNNGNTGNGWARAVKTFGWALSLVADGGTIYLKGVAHVAISAPIDKDVTIVFSDETAILNVLDNYTLTMTDGKTLTIKSSANPLPNGAIKVQNKGKIIGGNFVFDYSIMLPENQSASAAIQLLRNAKIDGANITITNTNLLAGGTSETSKIVNSVINHNSKDVLYQRYNELAPYNFENTTYNYKSNDDSRIRFGKLVTMTNSTLNIDSQQGADYYAIVFGDATTMTNSTVNVANYGSILIDTEHFNAQKSSFSSDGIHITDNTLNSDSPRLFRTYLFGEIGSSEFFTVKDIGIGRVSFVDSNRNNYEYGFPIKHNNEVTKSIPLPKVTLIFKSEDEKYSEEITLIKGTSLEDLSGKVHAGGVLIDKAVVEKLEHDIETEKGMDYSLCTNGDISTPYHFTNIINENTTVVLKPSLKAPDPKAKVSDPTALTDAEKNAVRAAVKEANPGLNDDYTITVEDNGTVTVTKDGAQIGTIAKEDTVEQGFKAPSPKVKVVDVSSLTFGEIDKIEKEFINANFGFDETTTAISIDAKTGTITITDKATGKTIDTIAGEDVIEKGLNKPEKLKVSDPAKLTDAEKDAVKAAVKEANPGLNDDYTITVADDGTVTVTKADGTPIGEEVKGANVVEQGVKSPSPKVPVTDPQNLTDEEKEAVKEAIKNDPKLPENATIEVANDGTITIKDADGNIVDTIAGEDAVRKSDAASNDPQAPKTKVEVDNKENLTTSEKELVKSAIKKANPNLPIEAIEVANDGTVTITYPDRTKDTIPGVETVEENDGAGLFDGVLLPPQTTTQPVEPTTKTVQPLTTNSLLNTTEHKAYIFGYPDGTIKADNNITRAEVSALLARLLKNQTVQQPSNYTDVKEGEWYNEAIALMSQNKIVEGYENGEFRPNAPITRAEFAAMVARFDQLVANNTTFTDVSTTHWAYKYIASATGKGWMTGYPDGEFKPEQNITRAEVVTVTNRMLDRYADEKAVINDNGVTKYTDLTAAHWAYYNMNEATNGHDYAKVQQGVEVWSRLNGEEFKLVVVK